MRTDDLVLEALHFYRDNPGRKHYIATAQVKTAEMLNAVLNPYANTSMVEVTTLQRMACGWHDDNANTALSCTHAFRPNDLEMYEQIRHRLRHPNAKTFVQMKPVEDQDSLLFRVTDYGFMAFKDKKACTEFMTADEGPIFLRATWVPGKWFKSKIGTEFFCLAKPYTYT